MKVSAQYAEEHFADILHTALRGEDVEIATPEQASVRMALATSPPKTPSGRPRRELWGAWEGLVSTPDQKTWDEMHEQFLREMPDFAKVGDGAA
jgi:antitoxin (DNA-binding transcriptional repressor) of toxin-antitoxin stability system